MTKGVVYKLFCNSTMLKTVQSQFKIMVNTLERKVDTLLEGCMPDQVASLQYIELELDIPKNVKLVKIGNIEFLLYAKTKDFRSLQREDSTTARSNGWPLEVFEPMITWAFDNPRSLITRDGRIYLAKRYLKEGFDWYLNFMPLLLKDCKEKYSRDK